MRKATNAKSPFSHMHRVLQPHSSNSFVRFYQDQKQFWAHYFLGPNFAYRWFATLILLLATGLRLWGLHYRPPHFDEGVNGMFIDWMRTKGIYHYDPHNYHGPLHFYVLFFFQTLFGRHIWALRLPEVIVNLLTIGLVLKFNRFFGKPIALIAAFALAVSPGTLFFARDAIHESWLGFFLVLMFYGLFGLWQTGSKRDLWAFAIGITGMILIKETYIIHLGSLLCASVCVWIINRNQPPPFSKAHWIYKDLLVVLATCTFAILFFYSGGFMAIEDLKGIYLTYASWIHKSQVGEGHIKPFFYWTKLLFLYEAMAFLGIIFGILYLLARRPNRMMSLLILYGLGTLCAYSLIPYKTPWCILSIVWPFFFPFATGVCWLLQWKTKHHWHLYITVPLLIVLVEWTFWKTISLNFYHYADEKEKYVYVQTFEEIRELTEPLFTLVKNNPLHYNIAGLVINDSPHPLPWLLGDFYHTGYYYPNNKPKDYNAAFLVVTQSRVGEVELELQAPYFKKTIHLRSGLEPQNLYFSVKDFQSIWPNRTPEFQPHVSP